MTDEPRPAGESPPRESSPAVADTGAARRLGRSAERAAAEPLSAQEIRARFRRLAVSWRNDVGNTGGRMPDYKQRQSGED